uniref:Uncharacterized protein n=1 Tax=Nelumbo nucifera TaxID=4432 RepID=A0A822XXS6_NELNU|nr:TPA_asm: hypothetical protein HUJ06_026581 [Nelumbo nucifera]
MLLDLVKCCLTFPRPFVGRILFEQLEYWFVDGSQPRNDDARLNSGCRCTEQKQISG